MAARFRERAAGADGGDGAVGLDHVAGAADDIHVLWHRRPASSASRWRSMRSVRHSLPVPQRERGEIAAVLFELGFKAREQREGIGGGAGETGDDFAVVEAAQLLRAAL